MKKREEWLFSKYRELYLESRSVSDEVLLCVPAGRHSDYVGDKSGRLERVKYRISKKHTNISRKYYLPRRCAEIMKLAMFPDPERMLFW